MVRLGLGFADLVAGEVVRERRVLELSRGKRERERETDKAGTIFLVSGTALAGLDPRGEALT